MKKSAFHILGEFEALYWELEENGGELTPEIEEALGALEMDAKEKLVGYARFIQSLQESYLAIEARKQYHAGEAKGLNTRMKSTKSTITKLRETMKELMGTVTEEPRLEYGGFKFHTQAYPSADIPDPEKIDPKFKKFTLQTSFDGYLIAPNLKEGETIEAWKESLESALYAVLESHLCLGENPVIHDFQTKEEVDVKPLILLGKEAAKGGDEAIVEFEKAHHIVFHPNKRVYFK